MRKRRKRSPRSIFLKSIGLLSIFVGGYVALGTQIQTLGIGLISIGMANLLFGFTHGFHDHTPRGRQLYKIGAVAYLIGIPLLLYGIFAAGN